ncbi:MAG TPA: hypothetical protein VE338_02910 [Ktedonobacterales bacterium]|jgi:hypothetical protein|nr:hypothetical protein [Ktedonobacterales bacterium]
MSASTIPICSLGLSPDDLSAWRDHALSANDERRIADHIGSCQACQRTVAGHEALAAALRAERSPAPDPRNWPQLQARIGGDNRHRRAAHRLPARPARRPALWGGLGAVAAVLLISTLFFRLFSRQADLRGASSHVTTPTIIATPQALTAVAPTAPIVGPKLNWQMRMAPESVIPPPGNQTYTNGFAFSPTDASTAYICATTNATLTPTITVWATHDGAATWTHVGDLPSDGEVAQCSVIVDAADPMRLTVTVSAQNSSTYQSSFTTALSDDGGKTWRMIGSNMRLVGLNTQQGVSIADVTPLTDVANPNNPQYAQLSASRDDWKTFQAIDAPLAARGLAVYRVWRRPGDGALLVVAIQRQAAHSTPVANPPSVATSAPPATTLWQSADLGEHWTQLPTPPNMLNVNNMLVAQPVGNAPWKACGFQQTGSGATLNQLIGCTLDGGRTWQSRPLPALKQSCGSGCLAQQVVGWDNGALLPDGSLIVPFYTGPTDPNAVQTQSMFHLFSLTPGATQWQDHGSWPGSALTVIASAPAGTLVSYSGSGSLDGPGGELVGHLGGDVPNRGVLAFATLP